VHRSQSDGHFFWDKLVQEGSGINCKIYVYQGMAYKFWHFLQMEASQQWIGGLVEGGAFSIEGGEEGKRGGRDLEVKGKHSMRFGSANATRSWSHCGIRRSSF
jgi:hypothetical protein